MVLVACRTKQGSPDRLRRSPRPYMCQLGADGWEAPQLPARSVASAARAVRREAKAAAKAARRPGDKGDAAEGGVKGGVQGGSRRRVILVMGGAFNPVHPGHIGAMETARRAVQAAGAHVVAGHVPRPRPLSRARASESSPRVNQPLIGARRD